MEDAPATNMARFAFVAHELMGRANFADAEFLAKVRATKKLVCELYETTGESGGLWLHDCCAVAIYFCPFCLNPTALYNQA